MRLLILSVATFHLLSIELGAQRIPSVVRDSATCAGAVAALNAGTTLGGWSELPNCGEVGATALAKAWSAAGGASIPRLADLYRTSLWSRSGAVFNASGALASDASATAPARLAALLAFVAQVEPFYALRNSIPIEEFLASGTISMCPFELIADHPVPTDGPLPADSALRVAMILDVIRRDSSIHQPLRKTAQCARDLLSDVAPLVVPVSAISLVYVCDNEYRVRNDGLEWIDVEYEVARTNETGAISVGPGKAEYFSTENRGTVRLKYFGVVILTATNGARKCA